MRFISIAYFCRHESLKVLVWYDGYGIFVNSLRGGMLSKKSIPGLLKSLRRKIGWKRSCRYEDSVVVIDATMAEPSVLRDALVSWENQSVPVGKIIVYLDESKAAGFGFALARAKAFLPLEVRKSDPTGLLPQRECLSLSAEGTFSVLARGDVSYPACTMVALRKEWDVPAALVYAGAVANIPGPSTVDCGVFSWRADYLPRNDTVPLLSGGLAVGSESARLLLDCMGSVTASEAFCELTLKEMLLECAISVKAVGEDAYTLRSRAPWKTGVFVDEALIQCVEGGYFTEFCDLERKVFAPYRSAKGNVLLMAGQADLCGANIALLEMHKHLLEMGEHSILVLPARGQLEEVLKRERLPYYDLGVGALQWVSPLYYTQEDEDERIADWVPLMKQGTDLVRGIIEKLDMDLVHENTSGSYMASAAAEEKQVGRVWHIREFNEEDHGQRLWQSMDPYRHFAESDACICISKSIYRKYAERIGNESNLRLIYDGIAVDNYFNPSHVPFKDRNRVVIACAGRICEGKGQKLLVQAMALLPREVLDRVEVKLIGPLHEEDYVNEVKDAAQAWGILDKLEFPGVLMDMKDVWPRIDIAVVPSRFEAFGRCSVEAMLAGCLVIGNNAAGTAETVEDGVTGFLFERDSAEGLASKIVDALADISKSQEIAARGQLVARERFSSLRNAQEVFDLHQEIIAKRKAATR